MYALMKLYIFLAALTGILIFLAELMLVNKSELLKYKNISKNSYLYNTEKEYNIACLYYDFLRYVKNDLSLTDVLLFTLLGSSYTVYLLFLPYMWAKGSLLIVKIIFCKLIGIDKTIKKPNFSKAKLEPSFYEFIACYLK